MIAGYIGLTISHEQALADAFAMVGLRHAVEPEMRNAARLHSNWCHGHLGALQPMVERYGAARSVEGERLRRTLFRGRRSGGFGLIRDLHDLLTMAAAVRGCWTALLQGARERRDGSLESVCRACDGETARQVAWIETKLRQASPQALTVPPDTVRELGASLPNRADVAAILDLVPGSAIRRAVPLAPITTALVVLAVILPLAWTNARRRR
jgi:hypothetical protein